MSMSFDLKLGFKCNNNCLHCVVANKRNTIDLTNEELYNIIKNIPEEHDPWVQITGGEPSIYKNLPYILELCKKQNLKTIIQTNGTGFSDLNFLKTCAPYIDDIHIAIHSCYPEIHDSIVGTTGMWEKTMQGLDNIISENLCFTTQTVLSKRNIDSLYDTFSFIQSKKPGTYMSMTYPHLNGNALKNIESVSFRYIDKKDIIQKVLKKYHKLIFSESIPYCHLHPYAHKVESLERDIYNNYPKIGIDCADGKDLIKNYNALYIEQHVKIPSCKECVYDPVCIGVWKEYVEYHKDELDLYPIKVEE